MYGTQSRRRWAVGENEPQQVIDALRSVSLWRVSVFGPVLVNVEYGTAMRRVFSSLRAPLVMTIPGQAQLYAWPVNAEHDGVVECTVTLTPATAGEPAQARKIIDSGGIDTPFDLDAVRFVAFVDSTLNISGVVVAVPALSSVPLVAGALLTIGRGFQEFEA